MFTRPFLLLVVFLVSLCLRMLFVSSHPPLLVADELDYDRLAVSLLEGKGYINTDGHLTASRPPLYSFMVYLAYRLLGYNHFNVRLLQVFTDSLLCLLVYYLAGRLLGQNAALLAAFLSCIHLGFIAQSARILSDGMATIILCAAMIFFHKSREKELRPGYLFLTGFTLGVLCLARSNFTLLYLLVLCVLVCDLIRKRAGVKAFSRYILISLAAFLIPVAPWTMRNYMVFHRFVPISTFQGIALYASYKPLNGRIYGFTPKDEVTRKSHAFSSEAEQSRFLTGETIKFIKGNPSVFFKLIRLKLAYFFSPLDWELINSRVVYNYLYAFCFPFFIMAVFMFRSCFNKLLPLYLPIVCSVITAVVLFGIPRFRIPVEPYIIMLAAYTLVCLYEKASKKSFFTAIVSGMFLANFLLFLYSGSIKSGLKAVLRSLNVW